MNRHQTKTIKIGSVQIGGNNPIAIQSMTNTDTCDVKATVSQIKKLAEAGCDLVRVAVPEQSAVEAFAKIKKQSPLPVVADIHFDYRLAIGAIEAGADKIRINPGNMAGEDKLKQVIAKAKTKSIPIRIGVNAGSTTKDLVALAVAYCEFFENQNFTDIVISLKSSSVQLTLDAYRRFSQKRDYPLHIGITEAGTEHYGIIKSSVGIGALLAEGLGDTVRVSLTADPVKEVETARYIMKSLGLIEMAELIACPTCGRTEIDIISLAKAVEKKLKNIKKNITVAVMGCVVNGPGEAAHADYGIAGGKKQGIIFAKGKKIKTVPEKKLLTELMAILAENEKLT